MTESGSEQGPGFRMIVVVFVAVLAIVALEVMLAYRGLPARSLMTWLLIASLIEAALIVMFVMRMRYESKVLAWSLFPALIFVFFMMNHIWPDAVRVNTLRLLSR